MNMVNKKLLITLGLTFMIAWSQPQANSLVMRRVQASFPETMSALQNAIVDQGYTVSRVQRVDIGLIKTGHKTDRYRLVFFGKAKEINKLSLRYPRLTPFLPLKIVVFAEGDDTMLLVNDMRNLESLYNHNELNKVFRRWSKDILNILEQARQRAENQ